MLLDETKMARGYLILHFSLDIWWESKSTLRFDGVYLCPQREQQGVGSYNHGSLSIMIWYGVQLQIHFQFFVHVVTPRPFHSPWLCLIHLLVVTSLLVSHELSKLFSAVVTLVALQRLVTVDVANHVGHQ